MIFEPNDFKTLRCESSKELKHTRFQHGIELMFSLQLASHLHCLTAELRCAVAPPVHDESSSKSGSSRASGTAVAVRGILSLGTGNL